MRWIAFWAVAGCYAPAAAPGAPCDPIAPNCPAGQACRLQGGSHVCTSFDPDPPTDAPGGSDADAPPGPPTDLDNDGVPNADDNCPSTPNTNQYNEDLDGFGDVCDDCPPFPSTGSDGDNDGVGDLCDPDPTTGGDQITLFEGFAGGNVPQGWMPTGTWSVVAGNLTSVGTGTVATLVIPYTGSDRQTMRTIATITAQSATTGGAIGIVDRFNDAGTDGLQCGGSRSAADGTGKFGLLDASNGGFIATLDRPFTVGVTFTIMFRRTNDSYDCDTSRPAPPRRSTTRHRSAATAPRSAFATASRRLRSRGSSSCARRDHARRASHTHASRALIDHDAPCVAIASTAPAIRTRSPSISIARALDVVHGAGTQA